MERIVLGSGKLYVTTATISSGVYSVPADNTIEVAANLLGYIKGGATLEYTPTFYTVKDDLGIVSKKFLTEEAAVFKSGILTWNGDVLDKLSSTATVDETGTRREPSRSAESSSTMTRCTSSALFTKLMTRTTSESL